MNKLLKVLLIIVLLVVSVYMTSNLLSVSKSLDQWGLTFTFYIVPVGMINGLLYGLIIALLVDILKKNDKRFPIVTLMVSTFIIGFLLIGIVLVKYNNNKNKYSFDYRYQSSFIDIKRKS
ncbi:MAG: hypothetical protein IJH20_03730 [Bacilli bacterium]|nr:hypothetical protein [Bacilli bacterium]